MPQLNFAILDELYKKDTERLRKEWKAREKVCYRDKGLCDNSYSKINFEFKLDKKVCDMYKETFLEI